MKRAIERLEALERKACVLLSWQVAMVERQRKLLGDIGTALDILRERTGGEFCPGPRAEPAPAQYLGRRLVLTPLLSALFGLLAKGSWHGATALIEGVYQITGKQLTKRALLQGIYRLKRELAAAGIKSRIEYSRRMGWRFGAWDADRGDR